jgi:hypothetical protein
MGQFGELVPVSTVGPFNIGLHSANEATMRSLLGSPDRDGLDTTCNHNDQASANVADLVVTQNVAPPGARKFDVTGIGPAVESLARVFAAVQQTNPGIFDEISSSGMLCVRFMKPTSGLPSHNLSNHSWGTAVDIAVDGTPPTHRPDHEIPRAIAVLIKPFNAEGWYSGVGFGGGSEDDMHFEVAEETLQKWAADGRLG